MAKSISAILGSALHSGLEKYYSQDYIAESEGDAIKIGLEATVDYLDKYNENLIKFSKTIPNKQKAIEYATFVYQEYMKSVVYSPSQVLSVEESIKEKIDIEFEGQRLTLPVSLKGKLDLLVSDKDNLNIIDHKIVHKFSDPEKIDGAKIIQAVVYYFLVMAKYGRAPKKCIFREAKYTKNADGGSQLREYIIVYEEEPQYFDFFFRFYDDFVRAMSGEQVYIPNVKALYDGDIGIIAYIHRLDIPEEKAKLFKQYQVNNITDLLKTEIQKATNMGKLLKKFESEFIAAKSIDYEKMPTEEKIKTKLLEFGIPVAYHSTVIGAMVDRYRFMPSMGVKMSKILSCQKDIEQVTGASGVRILAPEPGTSFVSFDVPKTDRTFYGKAPRADGIKISIGVDVGGNDIKVDISEAPHILIAGSTGSGKSVMLGSIISSLRDTADLVLLDPKGNELVGYSSLRYEDTIGGMTNALYYLISEMDSRYSKMKQNNIRKWTEKPIVCVIDEFADLIMQGKSREKDVEKANKKAKETDKIINTAKRSMARKVPFFVDDFESSDSTVQIPNIETMIIRLAQKARACGIHLIIATQRPSVDIITGLIKANFPTRIALRTSSEIDSRVILDQPGAEKLLGKGDALLMRSDSADLIRIQGYSE